jgi:uncharacterized membrane protein YjdF
MPPVFSERQTTSLVPIGAFVALYMLGLGGFAVSQGNKEFLFYGVIMLVLIGLVMYMHGKVRFTMTVVWLLAIWGFLHMAGGTIPIPRQFMASLVPPEGTGNVLYNFRLFSFTPKYDQLVHAFGFFSATLAAWEALRVSTYNNLRPTFGALFAIICVGMGLGALNEVVEFIAVLTIPNTNVGGYENTGWDLVSNLAGCIFAAMVIPLRSTRR